MQERSGPAATAASLLAPNQPPQPSRETETGTGARSRNERASFLVRARACARAKLALVCVRACVCKINKSKPRPCSLSLGAAVAAAAAVCRSQKYERQHKAVVLWCEGCQYRTGFISCKFNRSHVNVCVYLYRIWGEFRLRVSPACVCMCVCIKTVAATHEQNKKTQTNASAHTKVMKEHTVGESNSISKQTGGRSGGAPTVTLPHTHGFLADCRRFYWYCVRAPVARVSSACVAPHFKFTSRTFRRVCATFFFVSRTQFVCMCLCAYVCVYSPEIYRLSVLRRSFFVVLF